jgi:hypothetical protein
MSPRSAQGQTQQARRTWKRGEPSRRSVTQPRRSWGCTTPRSPGPAGLSLNVVVVSTPMPTRLRNGELVRGVFEVLMDAPEGLPAAEVLKAVEARVPRFSGRWAITFCGSLRLGQIGVSTSSPTTILWERLLHESRFK